nr:hypothetical protein CFP56_23902 [Quercus suber]
MQSQRSLLQQAIEFDRFGCGRLVRRRLNQILADRQGVELLRLACRHGLSGVLFSSDQQSLGGPLTKVLTLLFRRPSLGDCGASRIAPTSDSILASQMQIWLTWELMGWGVQGLHTIRRSPQLRRDSG